MSNNANVLSISASNNQVKVYAWNGSSWTLRDTISGTGGFGSSISFDSTGSKVAIGSPTENSKGTLKVFYWDGSNYIPVSYTQMTLPTILRV